MPVAEVLDLLRCPVCAQPLSLAGPGVHCPRGHRFDLARQGYLNLLRGGQPRHADTAEMVAARERFLGAGHYRPVATGLAEAVRAGLTAVRGAVPGLVSVLEAGAGSGWYLAALLDALPGRGVALDISAAAVRRAARAHPRVAALVADTWQPLPLADGRLDVVTSVFAPRNLAEFARVLKPDGVLAVATPLPDHLVELRRALGLLEIGEDKQERLAESLAGSFHPLEEQVVAYQVAWSPSVVADLVAMGPNAFHLDPEERAERLTRLADPTEVTVAVSLGTWALRR